MWRGFKCIITTTRQGPKDIKDEGANLILSKLHLKQVPPSNINIYMNIRSKDTHDNMCACTMQPNIHTYVHTCMLHVRALECLIMQIVYMKLQTFSICILLSADPV